MAEKQMGVDSYLTDKIKIVYPDGIVWWKAKGTKQEGWFIRLVTGDQVELGPNFAAAHRAVNQLVRQEKARIYKNKHEEDYGNK